MSNMQPSPAERRHENPLLGLSELRLKLVDVSADNAIYAGQATRPAIVEQVYREASAPVQEQPTTEVAPAYPAASVALSATVETAPIAPTSPNLLTDTAEPDMFDNEAYLRSIERPEGSMGRQVDEAYAESGMSFEDAARANVNALFQRAETDDDSAAYAGQEV